MKHTLLHPLPDGRPTGKFGWRPAFTENGVHIPAMPHEGQDYAAPIGTPILAAHDGLVVSSFHHPTGGNMLTLAQGNIRTRYLHMNRLSPLRIGDWVNALDVIGEVGETGSLVTGPHLHFEVWVNGIAVDPVPSLTTQSSNVINIQEKDDGMYRPTVHVRTEGSTEYMRAHPEIGKDLKQFTGSGGTGKSRKKGGVTTFKGFEVTTDLKIGIAWARMHAAGSGKETSRTKRAEYITIQKEASRIAAELN